MPAVVVAVALSRYFNILCIIYVCLSLAGLSRGNGQRLSRSDARLFTNSSQITLYLFIA